MDPASLVATARTLQLVATEAIDEPDVVMRRPGVVHLLGQLANDDEIRELLEGVAPGRIVDPSAWIAGLADAVAPYRNQPLDDAPEVIEELTLLTAALLAAANNEQLPDQETAVLA
jgi:hypothetical protein